MEPLVLLWQGFLEPPQHCTFCMSSLISSLVTTPKPEMDVSDKGDMQHVQLGRLQERVWEPLLYGIVKMHRRTIGSIKNL